MDQASPVSAATTRSRPPPAAGAAWGWYLRRWPKPMISSSMPSAANPAGYSGAAPAASSASARWMAVSWAWRRVQKASGDGAAMNVAHSTAGSALARVSTSAAWPARNQSSRSASAAPPRRISASDGPSMTSAGPSATCLAAHRWM